MTAYPSGAVDARIELKLGGAWTDLTSRTGADGLTGAAPAWGSPDGAQAASPATVAAGLDNNDGALTPGNPLSPYYGQLATGTPARLSVAASGTRLRMEADAASLASCPSSSALNAAGDFEIRLDCDVHWSGAIAFKNGSAWEVFTSGTGGLGFTWWDGGGAPWEATSGLAPPAGRVTLRVLLAVATGTVSFWYGRGGVGSATWTPLGDPVAAGSGATSVQSTTGTVCIGHVNGTHWQAEIRRGGSVVASPDFTAQAPGVTSFADAQGNTWTLSGSASVSDRDYRLHAAVAANVRTTAQSGGAATAQVTAGGLLRRLQKGDDPPLSSALKRGIISQSGTLAPVAYWPFEDLSGATSLASAIGGPAMAFSGSGQLASDSSFGCSLPLPVLGTMGTRGSIPPYASHGSIVCRFLLKQGATLGTVPSAGWPLVRVYCTGTVTSLDLRVFSASAMGIAGTGAAGSVFASGGVAFGPYPPSGTLTNSPLWVSLELTPSGGNVNWAITLVYPGAPLASTFTGSYAGTIGNALAVQVHAGALSDTVVGHVSVQSDWASLFSLSGPLAAWDGEAACDRVVRLCKENGLLPRIAPGASAAMGAQRAATLMQLLEECESADGGILHEPRESLSIGYRPLSSLYSQAPAVSLSYAAGEVGLPPSAADDDQYFRNDLTAVSPDGTSARVTLADGSPQSVAVAGAYADSVVINPALAGQLADMAGLWLSRLSTAEPRYGQLTADLGALSQAQADACRAVRAGDLVEVTGVPLTVSPAGVIRQLAAGGAEAIGPGHRITWATRSAAPYSVIVLDDPDWGRLGTDGSALRLAATAAAASLAVVNAGVPWTTAAGDMPFDIAVAGEQVTVTAAGSGASASSTSPPAFHQVTSISLPPGTWTVWWTVQLGGTAGAPEANNFQLALTPSGSVAATSVNAAAAGTYPQAAVTVTVDGVTNTGITIRSGGSAATSGAVYTGTYASPQLLTVTRAVNGISKAQAAGAAVTLWNPPRLAVI